MKTNGAATEYARVPGKASRVGMDASVSSVIPAFASNEIISAPTGLATAFETANAIGMERKKATRIVPSFTAAFTVFLNIPNKTARTNIIIAGTEINRLISVIFIKFSPLFFI